MAAAFYEHGDEMIPVQYLCSFAFAAAVQNSTIIFTTTQLHCLYSVNIVRSFHLHGKRAEKRLPLVQAIVVLVFRAAKMSKRR